MNHMKETKKRISENRAAIPELHNQATELDLRPQPWWDRDFYEHAIKVREAELEAKEGGE